MGCFSQIHWTHPCGGWKLLPSVLDLRRLSRNPNGWFLVVSVVDGMVERWKDPMDGTDCWMVLLVGVGVMPSHCGSNTAVWEDWFILAHIHTLLVFCMQCNHWWCVIANQSLVGDRLNVRERPGRSKIGIIWLEGSLQVICIVISASPVKPFATQLTVRCSRCQHVQKLSVLGGPYAGTNLPGRCGGPDPDPDPDPGSCRLFPYGVVPDQSSFCDRQSWKVQEPPETVPTGELPRSVLVVVERSMVDKAPPGTRVSILCVPTLFHHSSSDSVQSVYLRVVGLRKATHGSTATFVPGEESAFRQLSQHPDVYRILSRSMAPSISGNYTVDIKKAILCMLLGGSRKRLPDGIALRGDINVLLLGDPSTAKSQFLKFASRAAPHWGLHFWEGFVGGRPDGIRRQGQAR